MSIKLLIILLYLFLCFFNICQSQNYLKWVNRTGTENDSLFNSRVYFHANHLYGPITQYRNYPYSSIDNEFEIKRLKKQHQEYGQFINKIWSTGFLLQIPLIAQGQTEVQSVAVVGKYEFDKKCFPLRFQNIPLDYPVTDFVDLKKLYKQTVVKYPKYTGEGAAHLKVKPIGHLPSSLYLLVSQNYAEVFKQSIIYGHLGIEILVKFQSVFQQVTEQNETLEYLEYKSELERPVSALQSMNLYLNSNGKPLELIHVVEIKYQILGFRIIDADHLILFEWFDSSAVITSTKWTEQTSSLKGEGFITVPEKQISNSQIPYSVNPWFKEAVVSTFRLENQLHPMEERRQNYLIDLFTSWWECDLFLKRQGKRMASMVEINEACLQSVDPTAIYSQGQEITLTRGHYTRDEFVYRKQMDGRRFNAPMSKLFYYNDGFWSLSGWARYRGILP